MIPGNMLLASLPDILMSLFFLLAAVIAAQESTIAEFLAKNLSLWFIYELLGAFFLLLWVALNEERATSRKPYLFRFVSTCAVYLGFALVMHCVFRASLSCVIMSAVGGVWALLNPLVRKDQPPVLRIGREAALAVLTLIVSFFVVAIFASIAEHILLRPFHRPTFEAATLMSIGAIYYMLRWQLSRLPTLKGTE